MPENRPSAPNAAPKAPNAAPKITTETKTLPPEPVEISEIVKAERRTAEADRMAQLLEGTGEDDKSVPNKVSEALPAEVTKAEAGGKLSKENISEILKSLSPKEVKNCYEEWSKQNNGGEKIAEKFKESLATDPEFLNTLLRNKEDENFTNEELAILLKFLMYLIQILISKK